MRLFGCPRFMRLVNEQWDRPLTVRERDFVDRHKAACPSCRDAEAQGAMALSMLRMSAIEADATPQFEERVLRRYRIQTVHESLQFWSPALIGAFVASVVVLAALQLVWNSSKLPTLQPPVGQARLTHKSPAFPDLKPTTVRSDSQ